MINRNFVVSSTALLMLLFSINGHSGWWPFSNDSETTSSEQEIIQISWDDLIPGDYVQPENPFINMPQGDIDKLMDGSDESNSEIARLEKEFNYAPVVPDFDGKRVKIPAYITPLEFNSESRIQEFLLVPYVGACMHTPPPPSNQIVYAKSIEAIEFSDMYKPVLAIGTLRTESVKSELAESGYSMQVEEVLPYSR